MRRVLRVDPALDRMAAQLDVLLTHRERLAERDEDLLANEVELGDHLGDRVLDLDPCVHLHEEVVAVARQQALDRPRRAVPAGSGSLDADCADPLPELLVDRGRRRLLDQLLMAALDGAVALAEVDDIAVRVREHLHLDVARVDDELLDIDVGVREVRLPLPLRALERLLGVTGGLDDLHPLATAAGSSLDQERVAELLAEREELLDRADRVGRAWNDRDTRLLHRRAGGGLVPHELDRRLRRPDPHEAGLFHGARERSVLREEAVAGMDLLRSSALGRVENALDREVALGRRSRPEEESLVRVRDVERGTVALGVDPDRADSEVAEGAEDADRDLPTVGNENLLEHEGPYSLHVVTLTAADQLTVARAASVPIVVVLYGWSFSNHNYWATAVFCVAMTTDWFDGRLARKQGRSSSVGSLLDPIADKVLVLAALVMLVGQGIVPAWMVAAIVVREVLITGLRQAAVERGVVLAARDLGKLKTWAQAVAAAVGGFAAAGAWTHRAAWWTLLVAVILTWLSGLDYARSAPRLLSRAQAE